MMDPKIIACLKEGQLLAQQGHWDAALVKWNEAIASSANDVEILSFVATLLAEGGKVEEAKIQIEHIGNTDPTKAAALAAQIGLDRWENQQDMIGAVVLSGLSLKIAKANDNIKQLAYTSGNLGNILSAAGSLEASLIHYENATTYYRQIEEMEWVSMMLSSAGGVLKDLERFAEAKEKLEQAIKIAAQNEHYSALTLGLLNLGSFYGGLQKFKQSSLFHQEALRIAWENQLPEYFRKSASNLALDLRNLGASGMEQANELIAMVIDALQQKKYDWAIFGLKYATLLVDRTMAPIGLADIFHTLSNVESMISETEGAIVHLEEACKLAREAQEDAALAKYSAGLSRLFLEQGKLQEAADACDEAIACASRSSAFEPLTAALGNRGLVALRQDQLHLAETLFIRQYQLTKENKYQQQCANAANSLGAVYEKMGDMLGAEKWFKISIEESEDYKWPAGLSSLVNMAILQRQRGEIEKAISTFNDALIQAVGQDNFDVLFEVIFNLGILYIKTNQPQKAKPYFDQVAEWNKSSKDPRKNALLQMNEAYLSKQQGEREAALEKFQMAYTFFRESDWINAAKCAVEAAILLLDSGRLPEAMEQILPAVGQYEQRIEKLSDLDAWRIHRDEEFCFQVFCTLTLQLYGPELALLASERSRGRAFRLALRRREAGHRTKVFDQMKILRQTALELVISGRAKGLKKEYVNRFVQVLNGAKDPQELNLDESWIKEWAGNLDASIIVYTKGYPDKLYAWVINQTDIHFIPIDLSGVEGLDGLAQRIKTLRKHLGIPERGAGIVRQKQQQDPKASLSELYNVLIEPLAKWLPKKEGARLCFIPWGPLFEIPFSALLDNQGHYLVDRYACFIVPTLYFFGSQQQRNGSSALVVGDPIPTQESSFGELLPLPFAVEEARQVAELYQTKPLIGKEASKKKVLDELPRANIVHFAAHGLLDEIYPLRSAVALTQTEDDNGLLYVGDLKKLMLSSQLIVLSACSSALGNVTGDGVLGLCREFLAAGTDSIVASIWAVGDRSSAFHMTHLHQRLREKPIVEALRDAQLATRGEFNDVSQWGAYSLWGWPEGRKNLTETSPETGGSGKE